jgi:hypothetical protein
VAVDVQVVTTADDVEAAALSVELTDFSTETAPSNDLLQTVGAISGQALEDPGRNAELGSRYLRGLLDQWRNEPMLAVASYNAGPGAVQGWRPDQLQRAPELNLRTLLRPAVFVPESKGLNDLLRDFRSNRNHLAIVIDEFGSTAGLITIEDVLEQIVGDIRDEFDDKHDGPSAIYALASGGYRVAGDTPISAVNEAFHVSLPLEPFDTIGGLVAHEHGIVPRRGESLEWGGLVFNVMLTRGGAVRWFKVSRSG